VDYSYQLSDVSSRRRDLIWGCHPERSEGPAVRLAPTRMTSGKLTL